MKISGLETNLKDEPAYRRKQVYSAIFSNLIEDWEEATNLPAELRRRLADGFPLEIRAERFDSGDGQTVKAVIRLDEETSVETVLMRHRGGRNTVCVSSQAGCALGCDFCLTARAGFRRNLTAMEIITQVLFFSRFLKKTDQRVGNVVFMGMGEPFLNIQQVLDAVNILNHPDGLGIGARKISISTVGIIPGIEELARFPLQVNLSFSLHAPDDALRERLMPVNRRYPLEPVFEALREYIEKTGRKVMIEYLLLGGVNDSAAAAEQVADLLVKKLDRLFIVNLIEYNAAGRYRKSSRADSRRFADILRRNKISVTRRYRFGEDIKAACGQLAGGSDN